MKIILKSFIFFFFIVGFAKSEKFNFKILSESIIFKEEGLYSCFPNMFITNDTLVVGFSTRLNNSHYDKRGGGKRFISTNGGLNWTIIQKSILYPGYKNNNNNYVITVPKNWRKVEKDKLDHFKKSNAILKYSKGKYWTSKGVFQKEISLKDSLISSKSLTLPQHALLMGSNLSSYIRRKDGLRILALFGKLYETQKEDQIFILRSINDGSSWDFIIPYESPFSLKKVGLGETALLETGLDSILGISRGSDGYLYSFKSLNNGLSWTLPNKMPIYGHPANIIKINRNQILCTYGYREEPIGIKAVVLDKESLNIISDTFNLRNDGKGNPYDTGYPMTIMLKDKTFISTYYISSDDGITHISSTKWRLF